MITILDYGLGNLGSIRNMLSKIGQDTSVASDVAGLSNVSKLIIPGVGAFDEAIGRLNRAGVIPRLNQLVLENHVPTLGICLGMQLLSNSSEEGVLPGLGWIDAETIRFRPPSNGRKLACPHMGWNTIDIRQPSNLLAGQTEDTRFYFVHSYHVRCKNENHVLATTDYGEVFHSVINRDSIFGVQFHPEKSHRFGLRLLTNFVRG